MYIFADVALSMLWMQNYVMGVFYILYAFATFT